MASFKSNCPIAGRGLILVIAWALSYMYSKIAEKDDNTMAERWQKADGILIFSTGSFILGRRRNIPLIVDPGSEANLTRYLRFLLKNIYQHLADTNVSVPSISSSVTALPTISPLQYVIIVNFLWALCLCINLTCAITTTMFQRWARRYVGSLNRREVVQGGELASDLVCGYHRHVIDQGPELLFSCYFSVLLFIGPIVYLLNASVTTPSSSTHRTPYRSSPRYHFLSQRERTIE